MISIFGSDDDGGGRAARARSLPPRARAGVLIALACLGAWLALGAGRASAAPFIGSFAPNPAPMASTVPSNGDVNPYGIVTVPRTVGLLHRGDLLISNFNDSANLQGTGTTIVQIPPRGGSLMPGRRRCSRRSIRPARGLVSRRVGRRRRLRSLGAAL